MVSVLEKPEAAPSRTVQTGRRKVNIRWGGGDGGLPWLPFFGFVLLHSASPPSLSSFSSRSFQRRTCSWRIFRNRVFFWSSLRAFSTSGSMYMSFKICCNMSAAGWCGQPGATWPSSWRGETLSFGQQLLWLVLVYSLMSLEGRLPPLCLSLESLLFTHRNSSSWNKAHAHCAFVHTVQFTLTQKSCFLPVLCWQFPHPTKVSVCFVFGSHQIYKKSKTKQRTLETNLLKIM